jgi:hypothetical protein
VSANSRFVSAYDDESNTIVSWDMEKEGLPFKVVPCPSLSVLVHSHANYIVGADTEVSMWQIDSKAKEPFKVFRGHQRPIVAVVS